MHIQSEAQIQTNRKRLMLLLILLTLPFVLAWLMVRFEIWIPAKTSNHGQLLSQDAPFYRWPWQAQDSFPESLKQHWLLVLATQGDCQNDCQQWQQQLQQVHKALGKEGDRVRRVFLQPVMTSSALPAPLLGMGSQEILSWHGLTMASPDWQARPWLGKDFQVLLVDPMGNLVTGYSSAHSARDLLRDLRRLLKASAAG